MTHLMVVDIIVSNLKIQRIILQIYQEFSPFLGDIIVILAEGDLAFAFSGGSLFSPYS